MDLTLRKVECGVSSLEDYRSIVPDIVEKVRLLAKPLRGLRIVHINATAIGGGVAEMLKSEVPLQNDLGLKSSWYVIPPDEGFFTVTKAIHNFLQGKEGELNEEQKRVYLDYNQQIAGLLAQISTDVLIIHDPQPAAALSFLNGRKPKLAIWRCHIDTSTPNQSVWDFLLPYLKNFDRYVFTLPDYSNGVFDESKISYITPVIDPFSPKNVALPKAEAKEYLKKMGVDITKPLLTQISRLDPWKDPLGVIDAYRLAKRQLPSLQLALVAQMATDDPEGTVVYGQVKKHVAGERGIFIFVNLPDNDRAVNAFQVGSDVILQKSIREGFGLTVTEAMWKGAAVVGGNVGGIRAQIRDGENGFLVNSSTEAAERIVRVISEPHLKQKLSTAAHQTVLNSFLLPHKLLKFLELFDKELVFPGQLTGETFPPAAYLNA